jgi:cytochrome c biogenesis protein CcdA
MDDKKQAALSLTEAIASLVDSFGFSLGNLLFAMFVLFGVMLFFEDLPSEWHNLVAAVICYVLLLGFVGGFEMRLIVFSDTKRRVAGEKPRGLPEWALGVSLGLQILGLVALVVYIVYRGLL